MRNLALLVMLFVTVPAFGAAQLLAIGFKGGVTRADVVARVDGADVATESRNAAHGGLVLALNVSPRFAIRFETTIVGRGFTLTNPQPGLAAGANLLYTDIPVLGVFKIPTGPTSMISPRVFAGPVLSLRATCKIPGTRSDCGLEVAKQADFSLRIGGGVMIGRGSGGLVLDLAYDLGMVNVNKSTMNADIKNRSIQFSIGFLMGVI